MIFVSYPVATSGAFVCGIIRKIVYGIDPPPVNADGSIFFPNYQIKSLHDSNIKLLAESNPKSKIVCITIDQEDYDLQEKNFQKKCIPALWSEDWYNTYKSNSYPPFEQNVYDVPKHIIQDILMVNRNYIENWSYTFPEDMSNILVLNFKEIMSGDSLVNKLQTFFNIDKVDNTVYQYVSNYRSLQ